MEDSVCQVRYNNICNAKQKRTEQQGRAERHGMSRHVTANGLGRLCSASGNVCILDKQMRYTRNLLFQSASSMFGQAHKPPSLYQNYQILIMLPWWIGILVASSFPEVRIRVVISGSFYFARPPPMQQQRANPAYFRQHSVTLMTRGMWTIYLSGR